MIKDSHIPRKPGKKYVLDSWPETVARYRSSWRANTRATPPLTLAYAAPPREHKTALRDSSKAHALLRQMRLELIAGCAMPSNSAEAGIAYTKLRRLMADQRRLWLPMLSARHVTTPLQAPKSSRK